MTTMAHNRYSRSVTEQIVQAVADAEGVPPTKLTPLGEVIDPDVLNNLFSPSSETPKELQCEYEGYTVVIEEDTTIRLE